MNFHNCHYNENGEHVQLAEMNTSYGHIFEYDHKNVEW